VLPEINSVDFTNSRLKFRIDRDMIRMTNRNWKGEIFVDRFKKVYSQGTIDMIEIWVDTETGVNYVLCISQKWKCGRLYPIT